MDKFLRRIIFISCVFLFQGCNSFSGPSPALSPALAPPSSVSYAENPVVGYVGNSITSATPIVTGGAATSFSVSLVLPSGLIFDTKTGIVSGTPRAAMASANYKVTAANSYGSASTTLTILLNGPSVFFGAGVTPFNAQIQESNTKTLESQIGRNLGTNLHFYYWGAPGPMPSPGPAVPGDGALNANTLANDPAIQGDLAVGRIPLISWRCGDNMANIASGADDVSIIIPAALALKSLNQPVMLRWFYEWNLNLKGQGIDNDYVNCFTQPYQSLAQQQAEFIAAWVHIWKVFQNQNVTNVTWIWCIAASSQNINSNLQGFLPPAPYVDYIGFDLYDKLNIGFVATTQPAYSALGNLGVPVIITESGENKNNSGQWTQSQWFGDAIANIGPGLPFSNIKGFTYFDSGAGASGFDWSLDMNGINEFATMGASPQFK